MGLLKSKLMLRLTLAVSIFGVAVGAVSTLAWFQINTSANNIDQATQTRNLATTATVYQDNNHANDDPYQITPTPDSANTLSYDHSKGGKATNFYIRQWTDQGVETTLQMFTNLNNVSDKAVYYNIKFNQKWKIYDATGTNIVEGNPKYYYGYSDIDASDPLLSSCAADGSDNITIGSLTGYYDVYFTSNWKIWIVGHSEETTSAEMGNETGYYIYGDTEDSNSSLYGHDEIKSGIPMYVNAAANTSDLAFYAGLRVSEDDVFYVASGDSKNPYRVSSSGDGNKLNDDDFFSFDTETGAITCNQVGYYCIALKSDSHIYINEWDGKEVDGSTRYTISNMADQSAQMQNVEKKARRNAVSNHNIVYAKNAGNSPRIHYWGGTGGPAWDSDPSMLSCSVNGESFFYYDIGNNTQFIIRNGGSQSADQTFSSSTPCYDWNSSSQISLYKPIASGKRLYLYADSNVSTANAIFKISFNYKPSLSGSETKYNMTRVGNTDYWYYNIPSISGQEALYFMIFRCNPSGGGEWNRTIQFAYDDSYSKPTIKWSGLNPYSSSLSYLPETINVRGEYNSWTDQELTFNDSTHLWSIDITTTAANQQIYIDPLNKSGTHYYDVGYTDNISSIATYVNDSPNIKILSKGSYRIYIGLNVWLYDNKAIWGTGDGSNIVPLYTVTFSNNGHGTAPSAQTIESGGKVTQPSAPTADGYTFGGWYKEAGCSNVWNFASDTVTSNKTIYAKWTAKTYTVTLNNNGATTAGAESVTATYNDDMPSIATNLPAKTGGYVFGGYWTSSDSGTTFTTKYINADGTSAKKWDIASDKTLYAQWITPVTITISISPSGYGSVSNSSFTVPSGSTISVSSNKLVFTYSGNEVIKITPTAKTSPEDGYTYAFSSWSKTSGTVTSNTAITANFTRSHKTYTVTLNKNGGTINSGNVTQYTHGTGATLPTDVTKTGYDFGGWYTASDFSSGYTETISTSDFGNKTYYAKWTAQSFTVTLNDNSGSGGSGSVTADYGSSMPAATKPTRTGYTFEGYYDTSAASGGNQYYNSNCGSARNWDKTSDTTLWARWSANSYTVTLNRNGGSGGDGSVDATYNSNMPSATMPTRTGYTFDGYWTSSDSGETFTTKYYNANGSSARTWNIASAQTLYAKWIEKTYDYYIVGNIKGSWSKDNSGAVQTTASYTATYVTWDQDISFSATNNEVWKVYRQGYSEWSSGNECWWGPGENQSMLIQGNDYFYSVSDGRGGYNVKTQYNGTFRVKLYLTGDNEGKIEVIPSVVTSNYTLYQYEYDGGPGASFSGNPNTTDGTKLIWNTSITLKAGYEFHIEGVSPNDAWGINTETNNDNIKATTYWNYYFTTGDDAKGSTENLYNVKMLYTITATSIEFDTADNTITVKGIALKASQFTLKTASGTYSGTSSQSATSATGTVTFSNVHLTTDTPWYLDIDGTNKFKYDRIASTVSILGATGIAKGTYFYNSSVSPNYIGTGFGGTYTIVLNIATGQMSISCSELDLSDFIAVKSIDNDAGTAMSTRSADTATTHTMTYTGTTHLRIEESLYFKNSNTATTQESVSCVHNYYFNGDIDTPHELLSSSLIYVSGQYLYSRVDLTLSYSITFIASTTHLTFSATAISETHCSRITFKHAENAGIYIETASNSTFTSNAKRVMMHTTSGKDSGGTTYLAQEAPIYTSGSVGTPLYLRVIKTHSNGTATIPSTAAAIREVTEYYYVAQDTGYDGFTSSTNTRNVAGNGSSAYVTVTVSGTWTISLRTDGAIHVEVYSGAATVSTEHEVPYYLIGRGMPGSGIRGCDYTVGKGQKLWTYGGNSSTIPCYVGEIGNNTSSSSYQGTGIALKKGDTFAICSASKLVKTFASNSVTGLSINTTTGIVTVNTSATYQIYLTGSVGSETINIIKGANGSTWTRDDENDIVSRNGVNIISSSGNTLTLGGNLDYSLLDAYGKTGYMLFIEISHVSTGASGNMEYTVTNSNNYDISVAKKNNVYSSATSYSDDVSIGDSETCSYTIANSGARSISASTTTSTCIRITIAPSDIKSMISSGTYTFSISISYTFTETAIS